MMSSLAESDIVWIDCLPALWLGLDVVSSSSKETRVD
jgi:hypothetical protein